MPGGSVGSAQVRPPSVEVDCMMPFTVRASIHSDLSRRSTIMCSCQSGLGNFTAPRRCQVAPLSVETNTFAPRKGSTIALSGKLFTVFWQALSFLRPA